MFTGLTELGMDSNRKIIGTGLVTRETVGKVGVAFYHGYYITGLDTGFFLLPNCFPLYLRANAEAI